MSNTPLSPADLAAIVERDARTSQCDLWGCGGAPGDRRVLLAALIAERAAKDRVQESFNRLRAKKSSLDDKLAKLRAALREITTLKAGDIDPCNDYDAEEHRRLQARLEGEDDAYTRAGDIARRALAGDSNG